MEGNIDKLFIDVVTEVFEKELKKNCIKNIVQTYEFTIRMIIDFCDRGDRNSEDIKAFCEGLLKPQNKAKFIKVITKEKE